MTIASIFLLPNGTFFIELIVSIILILLIYKYVIPPYLSWIGLAIWKPFDELFIGAIQAFIFALLTIMYLGMALSKDGH